MKKLRRILGLALVLLVIRAVACGNDDERPPVRSELTNRVWVDKVPEGPRDMVVRLALVDKGKKRRGVVMSASRFRVVAEQLRYRIEGKRLTLELPQEKRKLTFKTRVYRCDGPGAYDTCLSLKAEGRTIILYGRSKSRFGEDGSVGDELLPVLADGWATEAAETGPPEPDETGSMRPERIHDPNGPAAFGVGSSAGPRLIR